jgi:hypothetical protein
VRFDKAKNDKEFAKMLKSRSLGPEHSETQMHLRKSIRVRTWVVLVDLLLIFFSSLGDSRSCAKTGEWFASQQKEIGAIHFVQT